MKGDVKNVKNGFFRNFLLPYKKAVLATGNLLKDWEDKRKKVMIEREELRGKLEEIKRRAEGAKVKIEKKITTKGTLYGGVKEADIAAAIKDQLNLDIPASAVVLDKAIKAIGTYEIKLNFGEGIEATVPVEITKKA